MTLRPKTVTLNIGPFSLESGNVTRKDSGFQKTEASQISVHRINIRSQILLENKSHVGSLFLLAPMFPKDGVDLLLHEGPGHLGALQWALVSTGAIGLQQGQRLNRLIG